MNRARIFRSPAMLLLLWWTGLAALMTWGAWIDWHSLPPASPVRVPQAPWSNLGLTLAFSTLEALVVLAVLRPASYARSWMRAALACMLLAPFAALSTLSVVHGTRAMVWHALGVYVLLLSLITLAVISVRRALRHRAAQARDERAI